MDRSNVISLITETKTQNSLGIYSKSYTYKDVFCNISSVSAQEFFEGGRSGLNPSYRMTLFSGDYEGEEMLEYNGKTYAIYRTFIKGTDTIELYVERKGGTNGKQKSDNGTASGSNQGNP